MRLGRVPAYAGPVLLDLDRLDEMHPLLPPSEAAGYAYRGALALQRRGHAPGVATTVDDCGAPVGATLGWVDVDPSGEAQVDRISITEDGATAVSLAFVSVARGWTIELRLQRFQFGDWLMVGRDGAYVALEVSGIEGDFLPGRLREKLDQVRKVPFCDARFASVVAFADPGAALAEA